MACVRLIRVEKQTIALKKDQMAGIPNILED